MSATPIFEQLCRDYAYPGQLRPTDVTPQPFVNQPTVPSLPASLLGGGLGYERGAHSSIARHGRVYPSS